MTQKPEPQIAPICSYDLEITGDGSWVLGYMQQPATKDFPAEHMAFAARKDTHEIFTMQRRDVPGEDPYWCEPQDLRQKLPEIVYEKIELIADAAQAVSRGKAQLEPEQLIAFQGSSKAWGIGLSTQGTAYAQSFEDGQIFHMERPVSEDGSHLLDAKVDFAAGAVPERALHLMHVVASTAGYMELAEQVADKKQGFAAQEQARRTQGNDEPDQQKTR